MTMTGHVVVCLDKFRVVNIDSGFGAAMAVHRIARGNRS
jgi:NCAIR mutase (PurE)-related protein